MMTLFDTTNGDYRESGRWENILPGKLTIGIRVYPFQSARNIDTAIAHGEVELMLGFDLLEVNSGYLACLFCAGWLLICEGRASILLEV
jgi:hypothetical protein